MNLSLAPELERQIQAKIDSGAYASADEVVREALQLLDERDRRRSGEPRRDTATEREAIERRDQLVEKVHRFRGRMLDHYGPLGDSLELLREDRSR
jgi:putative addiction module CopG family antidote